MWALAWSSVVEHVLSVFKVLGSIPSSRERWGTGHMLNPEHTGTDCFRYCWALKF